MLDSRINYNFNRPIVSPQFRASQNVSKPAKAEEKQGMSTSAKWAIGLGLTALASYGVYYALTKGRVKAPKPTPKPENPIPEIKEMAIDVFKKDGRFEKGKAILKAKNGSYTIGYTGSITSTGKDGSKVVMEYVDGVLQKSTKTAKDGTKVFDKTYKYEDNILKSIETDGKTIFTKNILEDGIDLNTQKGFFAIDKKNNRLSFSRIPKAGVFGGETKAYYYTKDNKLKRIEYNGDKVTYYHDDGKTISLIRTGPDYQFYDKEGKFLDKVTITGLQDDILLPHHGEFNYTRKINDYRNQGPALQENFRFFRDDNSYVNFKRVTQKIDGKRKILDRFLRLDLGEKSYILRKDANGVKIEDMSGKFLIEQTSDEYQKVLEQAKILMKELKNKYRKGVELKEQAKRIISKNHSS